MPRCLSFVLLFALLVPEGLAQPTATVGASAPLAVNIDGKMEPLVPMQATPHGDGFLLLAKKADASAFDDPLVVLTVSASGAVTDHRVLDDLGEVLGSPTRLQGFGEEWVFAVLINDLQAGSPVKVVALNGLEHRVLLSVSSGSAYDIQTTGSLDYGMTTTSTRKSFRLTDVVPLAQDLFLITGQATLDVTAASGLDSTPLHNDSQPQAVLVNTAGVTRPLPIPDDGNGMVLGAAGRGEEFLAVYWTGSDTHGSDELFVSTFSAQFEPGDSFRLDRPSYGFQAAYPWGEGFLLYGQRGVDEGHDGPARLTLTLLGGRPAAGATRAAQDIEIGQGLPREGRKVRFTPAFLGMMDGQGVVAVAVASRRDGDAETHRAYLGRPGDGPADRWEMELGTTTYAVEPLALSPGGTLLSAHRAAYEAPWHLETITLETATLEGE